MLRLIIIALLLFAVMGVNSQRVLPLPNNLRLYVPLDSFEGLKDLVSKTFFTQDKPYLITEEKGPHGYYGSSHTAAIESSAWIGISPMSIPSYSDFTLSFYYSFKKNTSDYNLNMIHFSGGLTIQRNASGELQIYNSGSVITKVPQDVTQSGNNYEWKFVAITLSSRQLSVYDAKGRRLVSTTVVTLGNSGTLQLGSMGRGIDGLSCVMYFNRSLSESEIGQLPGYCKRNTIPIVWPRPRDLWGFWPLLNGYVADRSLNLRATTNTTTPRVNAIGPYGSFESSLQTTSTANQALFYVNQSLSIDSTMAFTVALHFAKGASNTAGCIFSFRSLYSTATDLKSFQICYESSDVVVYANALEVGRYKMIQPKGAWTFMAFTLDRFGFFTVYSKHGVFAASTQQSHILSATSFNNNGVNVGYAPLKNQGLNNGDKIACVMVYTASLTANEVKQAQESCRFVAKAPGCGVPKLPQTTLPVKSGITTVPKPGQFPFIASLRFKGNHVCSATIIDPFWLLTMKDCFAGSTNETEYQIVAGEHDTKVDEYFSRAIQVNKIILSPNSEKTAVIELSDPLDYSNDYVNEACILAKDYDTDLQSGSPFFVHGWGVNGRDVFSKSQNTPRYVSGSISSDTACSQVLNNNNYTGPNYTYCFKSMTSDTDVPCTGDMGAPLLGMANENPEFGYSERLITLGLYHQRGGACSANIPSFFSSVAKPGYEWVIQTIACAVPGESYPPLSKCPQ